MGKILLYLCVKACSGAINLLKKKKILYLSMIVNWLKKNLIICSLLFKHCLGYLRDYYNLNIVFIVSNKVFVFSKNFLHIWYYEKTKIVFFLTKSNNDVLRVLIVMKANRVLNDKQFSQNLKILTFLQIRKSNEISVSLIKRK